MAGIGENRVKHQTACDLLHRIRVRGHDADAGKFLCCDSRQCLFKVESAGRLFCILEKPGESGQ
jgi:hypothetical protein